MTKFSKKSPNVLIFSISKINRKRITSETTKICIIFDILVIKSASTKLLYKLVCPSEVCLFSGTN